ncbi:hypothetical protein BLNAU_25239 [Blattamonas nauphoetae]|uniref:Uncharacterized protein n=1 Tax=Blattamonas nauphoetae TaxID=2049346 RepID=A0ABQ9WP65_9EUKA|nr:hypothetical protein BLNAU_25239 [Blattamonas nauphoetae]
MFSQKSEWRPNAEWKKPKPDKEILTQQALEKERQRAEELVKKQQAAYAAAAEAQGQRDRRQRWSKGEEKLNLELLEAREQKMREMKAREDRERMIREEARLNFLINRNRPDGTKWQLMPKWMEAMLPSLHPSQYSQPDSRSYEPISVQKKKSPSSFPPLEDYFIKPKQAASLAKPKRLLQRQFEKSLLLHPNRLHRRVQREGHSQPGVSLPQSPIDQNRLTSVRSPQSTDKQKMQKVIFQFGELQECFNEQPRQLRLSHAQPDRGHRPTCHYNSRKRRNQLHNKNKVDDKKQREYEEKLKQLELEKKAQAGDKPWLTRGKSKEEKALEEEKRRIEQEMKDDEEAERRKVVKEAQMREREKREAEGRKEKKKQNRSHSVGDEEDVILVAPNRLNAHPQQRKHQLVRLQPAQATPKKVAATSKEGSPQATHTPPKIGSSKGKVEREKEKRSEDVQRSSPFANVERGG